MSQRHPLSVARMVAEAICFHMQPFAKRIAIAGSVRRQLLTVKDMEIVMQPGVKEETRDLFGEVTKRIYFDPQDGIDTYNRIERHPLVVRAIETEDGEVRRIDGDRFKSLEDSLTKIPIDLFIVKPPATWGCIYFFRTGPADFNKRAIQRAHQLGLKFDKGRLVVQSSGRVLDTPEEADVFRHLKAKFKLPEER